MGQSVPAMSSRPWQQHQSEDRADGGRCHLRTSKAESLCTSRETPEDTLYMELFKDPSGAYFLAYYQLWDGGYNSISPICKSAAKKFWARYS